MAVFAMHECRFVLWNFFRDVGKLPWITDHSKSINYANTLEHVKLSHYDVKNFHGHIFVTWRLDIEKDQTLEYGLYDMDHVNLLNTEFDNLRATNYKMNGCIHHQWSQSIVAWRGEDLSKARMWFDPDNGDVVLSLQTN